MIKRHYSIEFKGFKSLATSVFSMTNIREIKLLLLLYKLIFLYYLLIF